MGGDLLIQETEIIEDIDIMEPIQEEIVESQYQIAMGSLPRYLRSSLNSFKTSKKIKLEVDKERGAVTPLSNDKPSAKKVGQDEF